jgi:hypothetical protein
LTLTVLGASLCLTAVGNMESARAAPIERTETIVGWHVRPVDWNAVSVGRGEHSVEVRYYDSGCEPVRNVKVAARETRRAVSIAVRGEYAEWSGLGPRSCPAPDALIITVRLAHPLNGRRVKGQEAASRPDCVSPLSIPRLIGFAPSDAERALKVVCLHGLVHVVRRTKGVPRVVSQSPRPGAFAPWEPS